MTNDTTTQNMATPEELARRKKLGRRVGWGIVAGIVGLPVVLVLALGGASEPPATDACTRAYINDTAALARCYVSADIVGSDNAVELEGQRR